MNEINIEAMADILQEIGVVATPEQIAQIVKDYDGHVQMAKEVSMHQFVGHKPECAECKRLQRELDEVTRERDTYHDSVMKRRDASRVWLEGGEVKYEK